jgi:hypothetical protein
MENRPTGENILCLQKAHKAYSSRFQPYTQEIKRDQMLPRLRITKQIEAPSVS